MEIVFSHLKIVPPENAEQHDDTETRCHFEASLRNDSEGLETVRIVYAVEHVDGRTRTEEVAVAIEPGSTLEWDAWLSLWSRFEAPQTVEAIARMNVGGRELEVRESFEISSGERPRTCDPARQNMPSGGGLRGEV